MNPIENYFCILIYWSLTFLYSEACHLIENVKCGIYIYDFLLINGTVYTSLFMYMKYILVLQIEITSFWCELREIEAK